MKRRFGLGLIVLLCLHAQDRAFVAVRSARSDTTYVASTTAAGAEPAEVEYHFYKRRGEGSDLLTNPLRQILNGGYGILQVENRSNRLVDIDSRNGWDNVWRNLLNPIEAIEHKGWWNFISTEVLPVSFNSGNAQYWPNYWNHLLGGGFSYRLMREWYRDHGFTH